MSSLRQIQENYKILTPIFGGLEADNYYNIPLTTVTVHALAIWLTVKVPLVNFNNKFIRSDSVLNWHNFSGILESLDVKNPMIFSASFNRHTLLGEGKLSDCLIIRKAIVCEGKEICWKMFGRNWIK